MSETRRKFSANDIRPLITLTSKRDDDELKFTLSGVNVSIANALRRTILSDIPVLVFRVSPNEKNKCTIHANTCGLNNDIVKHRLSNIPIHVKNLDDFPYNNYMLEVNVENNTDTIMYVTTEHFTIKDKTTGQLLSQDKVKEIFPANEHTGQYIDFVRLRPKVADEIKNRTIHLTCDFDIGTAKEDGAYCVAPTCSYGNTIDETLQEMELQKLKQKWKDEGKKEKEIEYEATNWRLLEGKRIFKKDSFDFVIQSVGIHTNGELMAIACKLLIKHLRDIGDLLEKNDTEMIEIKTSDTTIFNCFDVILGHEDYTIGKILEYFMLLNYYETGMATFCGFKMMHPHDHYGILRVAYKEAMEQSTIRGHLKQCVDDAIIVYEKIMKEVMKLVN